MFRKLLVAFTALFLLPVLLVAQDGKLRGKITDKESGEPLIGANVILEGTTLGASSDINGEYIILSVPPGVYAVKASYIGYAAVTISNVRVSSNLTTTQDFQLSSTAIQTREVEVVAERPLIQRNTTNTVRLTTQEEIKNLPFRGIQSILSLNAGIVSQQGVLYVRGGRAGEVAYFVDGASATNVYFGTLADRGHQVAREAVSVIQEAVEELQLQTGGYTAEFGGANSGIVRTTVRTGGTEYKGTIDLQTDDFAKPGKDFLGTPSRGYRNFVGTASGPITKDLRFFVAGQHNFLRNRNHRFVTPFRFDGLVTDALGVGGTAGAGRPLPGPVEFVKDYLYRNWSQSNSGQGTLLYDLGEVKLRFTGSYGEDTRQDRHNWEEAVANIFELKRQESKTTNLFGNLRATHVLNPTTFYEIGVSYLRREFEQFDPDFGSNWKLYTDSIEARRLGYVKNDKTYFLGRYIGPAPYSTIYNFNFTHEFNPINTYSLNIQNNIGVTIDFTSQMNPQWELKVGGRLDAWTIRNYSVGDISSGMDFLFNSSAKYHPDSLAKNPALVRERMILFGGKGGINNIGYDVDGNEVDEGVDGPRKPLFASAYVQNKLEFNDMIVNAGLRFEFFDAKVLGLKNYENPDWDHNLDYFANVDSQLVETDPVSLLLPRISFSFPVTDRTVFYAMYGKYAQMPSLDRLYWTSNFLAGRVSPDSRVAYWLGGSVPGFFVRPERTTQYEIGIRQTVSDNFAFTVTGFYKDLRDQIQIKRIYNSLGVPIMVGYKNDDFGTVKGMELTFELRRTERIAARLNYTLSDARGSASTPTSSRNSVSDETAARFPQFISPFDYNQAHRGTLMLDYRFAKGDGGPILEGIGVNMLLTFNSGHAYTKILEPQNLGQASPWNIGVRPLIDSRTRNPIEAINSSTTPWVFNIDLNFSKIFYIGDMNLEFYVNVLNLLNTKQIIDVYPNTGTADDDGWLRSPLAVSFLEIKNYGEFYKAINLDNRWGYVRATGNDLYGPPRELRVGLKLEL